MLSKFAVLATVAFGSTAFAATGVSPIYGQCGGQGWNGPTSCASGSTCQANGEWYSQCIPGGNGGNNQPKTTAAAAAPKTTAASTAKAQPTTPANGGSSSGGSGSYSASFTEYGSGDQNNSGNCNVATTACGFFTQPGYSAAVSQNEFGVGPGAGAGSGCGVCWKLTAETDSNGNSLKNAGNSIVVQVTNLCPASGNPLCAQSSLTSTNQYGANLNFDLCKDSGAAAALFGDSGVGLAVGSAVKVSCSEWTGTTIH